MSLSFPASRRSEAMAPTGFVSVPNKMRISEPNCVMSTIRRPARRVLNPLGDDGISSAAKLASPSLRPAPVPFFPLPEGATLGRRSDGPRASPNRGRPGTILMRSDYQRLERFLARPDQPAGTMGIVELHGFLFAVAAAPELIKPSDWLPLVFGEGEPVFDSSVDASSLLGAIADAGRDGRERSPSVSQHGARVRAAGPDHRTRGARLHAAGGTGAANGTRRPQRAVPFGSGRKYKRCCGA